MVDLDHREPVNTYADEIRSSFQAACAYVETQERLSCYLKEQPSLAAQFSEKSATSCASSWQRFFYPLRNLIKSALEDAGQVWGVAKGIEPVPDILKDISEQLSDPAMNERFKRVFDIPGADESNIDEFVKSCGEWAESISQILEHKKNNPGIFCSAREGSRESPCPAGILYKGQLVFDV